MKVLVTGATGFVGREILRGLPRAGHETHILTRDGYEDRTQAAEKELSAQIHFGNILNTDSLQRACRGMDAVIHLVGIISEVGEATFENIHTLGTQNVLTAAREAGVRRFVHMSALGTLPDAAARYHQTKWAAEECVRGSGLEWTIFRPSIIYGPGDQFVNRFARMARYSPVLPVIGDGQAKLQPIPVADVATCFVRALNEPRSIGQTYDLCGRDVLTFEGVLDAIMDVTGRKRLKVRVPMGVARFQAAMLEFIFCRLRGKASPLNRDQLLMLREDNTGNAQPANEMFSLRPISFREGIASYLAPRKGTR
jgi:NADH dehydrogenase